MRRRGHTHLCLSLRNMRDCDRQEMTTDRDRDIGAASCVVQDGPGLAVISASEIAAVSVVGGFTSFLHAARTLRFRDTRFFGDCVCP